MISPWRFCIAIVVMIFGIIDVLRTPSRSESLPSLVTSDYGPTLNDQHSCEKNPYKNAINRTFDSIIREAQDWLDYKIMTYQTIAESRNYTEQVEHNHARFFPFEVMTSCNDLQCIGGECSDDLSKFICGMDGLSRLDSCLIYAIGSNNEWDFEEDLLERTNCQIHSFDCTGKRDRFNVPEHDNITFHHICLGAQKLKGIGNENPHCGHKRLCGDTWTLADIQQHLGHDKVDLLKLDIEGWEWPIFDVTHTNASMPMEVLVEVHYNWAGRGTKGVVHDHTMESAKDLVRLQSRLLGLGYVVVNRDDNPHCQHCTELTLVRVAC